VSRRGEKREIQGERAKERKKKREREDEWKYRQSKGQS